MTRIRSINRTTTPAAKSAKKPSAAKPSKPGTLPRTTQIPQASADGLPPKPQGSAAERRQRWTRLEIAQSAISLVAAQGFDKTTVEEIAKHVGYQTRSFFRYFPTKLDAIFIGMPELIKGFRARTAATVKPGDNAWIMVRRALIEATREFVDTDSDMAKAQLKIWFNDPALEMAFAHQAMDWERAITECFTIAAGLDKPDLYTEVAGPVVIGALRAAFRVAYYDNDKSAIIEDIERACVMLEQGFAKYRHLPGK